ncbi:hypothetical protein ABID47_000969 [Paenibacillus favisporus]|uniref:Uncharacterized protein n=1 Tax=Paenibacillus favisporus TaxID=221028 RepID=A0ABV2EXW7_9BACL
MVVEVVSKPVAIDCVIWYTSNSFSMERLFGLV